MSQYLTPSRADPLLRYVDPPRSNRDGGGTAREEIWIASSSATGRHPACLARGRLRWQQWWRRRQLSNGAAIGRVRADSVRGQRQARGAHRVGPAASGLEPGTDTEMAQAVEFILKQHDW